MGTPDLNWKPRDGKWHVCVRLLPLDRSSSRTRGTPSGEKVWESLNFPIKFQTVLQRSSRAATRMTCKSCESLKPIAPPNNAKLSPIRVSLTKYEEYLVNKLSNTAILFLFSGPSCAVRTIWLWWCFCVLCNTLYVVLTLNHTDRDDSCQQLLLSNCTDSEPVAFENPASPLFFYLSSLI